MSSRSFAGYTCQESLSAGPFGKCFRGKNKEGAEASVVVVDSSLAAHKGFKSTLAKHSIAFVALIHPRIVATKNIGRGVDQSIVVVCSSTVHCISLKTLLSADELEKELGLGIVMGAIEGLAFAHSRELVHGGVHPRSLVIGPDGVAKMSDFALSRALAAAAKKEGSGKLFQDLLGYVAPEILKGGDASMAGDVFAAAALVSEVVWKSDCPPKKEDGALAETLRKALDEDPRKRFANAGLFRVALQKSIAKSGLKTAKPFKISSYLRNVKRPGVNKTLPCNFDDLMKTVEDLDAVSISSALEDALADMKDASPQSIKKRVTSSKRVQRETGDLDPTRMGDSYDGEFATRVDDMQEIAHLEHHEELSMSGPTQGKIDSEEIRISKELMAPSDYDVAEETPLPAPRPFHADMTEEIPAFALPRPKPVKSSPLIKKQEVLVSTVSAREPTPVPAFESPKVKIASSRGKSAKEKATKGKATKGKTTQEKSISPTTILMILIAFVLLNIIAVAVYKLKIFNPDKNVKVVSGQTDVQDLGASARLDTGTIALDTTTLDAAVWKRIGRSPVQSESLSSSIVHEFRIEKKGYETAFLQVRNEHWNGKANAQIASLALSLRRRVKQKDQNLVTFDNVNAFPPKTENATITGHVGQGIVSIHTSPKGANIWLLVGKTPSIHLSGLPKDKDYSFKILKEKFEPVNIEVKAEDWLEEDGSLKTKSIIVRDYSMIALKEQPLVDKGPAKETEPGKKKIKIKIKKKEQRRKGKMKKNESKKSNR